MSMGWRMRVGDGRGSGVCGRAESRHGFGMEREREGEVRVWKGPGQRVEDWRCVFFARWVV